MKGRVQVFLSIFFSRFYKINLLILKNSVHVYNEMQPYFLPSNFPYVPIHKYSWVCLFVYIFYNPLSPVSAAHKCVGVGPSSGSGNPPVVTFSKRKRIFSCWDN